MFSLHSDKDKLYATIFRRFLSSALQYEASVDEIVARRVPQEVLLRVTPQHIINYFKECAFENYHEGAELHNNGMNFRIKLRANTLFYWKKAISHYMLNQNSGWDEVNCRGNPTKSQLVNSFIKDLVKVECKDLGVKSQARRAMEFKEFLTLLKMIRKKGFGNGQSMKGQLKWIRMAAFLSLQWQMIARMDDMMHLKFTNLCSNHDFPFCLKCTIRWSKNTNEERSCPNQMLCPSNDPLLCPLLNLGIYIEHYAHDETVTGDSFVFGGNASRYTIGRLFESLLSDDEFKQVTGLGGKLGNHSVRKGACTYAIRAGLLREYAIRRGRWRAKKQVVDIYIDVNQPYPDTLAACKLCGPKGSCRYRLIAEDVSDQFILEKVVPVTREVLGDEAGLAIGKAVLWAAFHERHHADPECPLLQPWLRAEIIKSYEEQYGVDSSEVHNPVQKVTVVPQGSGDEVHLIEIGLDADGEQVQIEGRSGNAVDDMTTLLSHQLQVQRQIEETRSEVLNQLFEVRHHHAQQLAVINKNLKRIAMQPVLRPSGLIRQTGRGRVRDENEQDQVEETEEEVVQRMKARLYRSPKTLFDLWHEYQFGLNGCKPAKDFTLDERGKVKSVYCRRKVFWDVITSLVNAGHTSEVAIDKVYACYGRGTSVTNILLNMVQDRKNGGHPNLRVGTTSILI